jgi:predicted transcriptional regulator of viral defense system
MIMEEKVYSQIRYWVEDLPKNGRRTFSLDDVICQFPEKRHSDIKNALARLARANKVQSVWRGFYAIVLPEYGNRGIVPPTEYINQLMSFLGNEYYVALLSAARQWGSAHQAPQVFQFICNKPLRRKQTNHVMLEPVMKNQIPSKYLVSTNVRSGIIKVSSPELTAVDMLLYPHRAGGLNHIATILADLDDALDFTKVESDFFEGVPPAAVQRMGYLLEYVTDEADIADSLYLSAKNACLQFRKTLLQPGKQDRGRGICFNERWKVIVNTKVEADI